MIVLRYFTPLLQGGLSSSVWRVIRRVGGVVLVRSPLRRCDLASLASSLEVGVLVFLLLQISFWMLHPRSVEALVSSSGTSSWSQSPVWVLLLVDSSRSSGRTSVSLAVKSCCSSPSWSSGSVLSAFVLLELNWLQDSVPAVLSGL
jgi:hypothetical protein